MMWFAVSMPVLYKPMFLDIQKKFIFRVWSGIVVWVLIALFIAIHHCWVVYTAPFDPRILGFVYGFILYGVYNFTNYATLYKYNPRVLVADTLWGTLNVGITSLILYSVFSKKHAGCA
jgi:uncharacterized membrane protein